MLSAAVFAGGTAGMCFDDLYNLTVWKKIASIVDDDVHTLPMLPLSSIWCGHIHVIVDFFKNKTSLCPPLSGLIVVLCCTNVKTKL